MKPNHLSDPQDRVTRALKVLKIVEDFAHTQQIGAAETIYQCDWVIQNTYQFIDDVITAADAFIEREENDE